MSAHDSTGASPRADGVRHGGPAGLRSGMARRHRGSRDAPSQTSPFPSRLKQYSCGGFCVQNPVDRQAHGGRLGGGATLQVLNIARRRPTYVRIVVT